MKRVVGWMLMVLLACGLAACGSQASSAGSEGDGAGRVDGMLEDVEVRLWTHTAGKFGE